MCRNIKVLYNVDPPAAEDDVRASALQYVRKISGFTKPSVANQDAFARSVDEVAAVSQALLDALVTQAPPRKRSPTYPAAGSQRHPAPLSATRPRPGKGK